jgi:hypothetical protein
MNNEYKCLACGQADTLPKQCQFQVGDTVAYTNEYGVVFPGLTVIGFEKLPDICDDRFIYLNTDACWFPHKESELTLTQSGENNA